jgi:hypothetical protein
MKRNIAIIAVCLFGFISHAPAVYAWGTEAHRITARIAEDMLTPKAKAAVTELLDGGDLAEASNYMDLYREALKREIPGSDRWHYDGAQICKDVPYAEYCEEGNCVSAQVPRLFALLSDSRQSKADRQMALRLLVHMIADLHQPLHAAGDNDRGGGTKATIMPNEKFARNLHLAWDVELVRVVTGGLPEERVAKDLTTTFKSKFGDWMRGDVRSWMAQSYGIAKRLAYGKIEGFACGELDGKPTGLLNGKPWPDTPYPIPQSYIDGAAGIIPILLAQSGARIGGMLNAALDPQGAKAAAPALPAAAPTKAPPTPAQVTPAKPPTSSLREALAREPAEVKK